MAAQDLPHVRESLLDAGNTASRAYYLFFSDIDTNLKQAQADIAALQDASGGGSGSSPGVVVGIQSVASAGALPGVVQLSLQGDADAPGNTYYYGTGPAGDKGFYTIASALAGTAGDITLTTGADGVTTFDLANVTPVTGGTLQAIATDSKGRVTQLHAVTVTGTAHQVIVANGDGSAATIGLSLPQDIDTTSSPSFAAVNLSADPTTALQAATKQYVDNIAAGLSWKAPVQVATTTNITLSGPQAIDGVSVFAGARVLVKDQTTQANNGIYVVQSGAWTRATDMDSWGEVPNASVFVSQGTTNADKAWTCTADAGGTLGTTAIPFVQFSSVMGGVTSFNGRNGVVVPTLGDYTFSLIGGIATVAQGGTGVSTASANTVFAGPTSGSSAAPSFRALVAADIPQYFRNLGCMGL